jgi:hypothetical protein
VRTGRLGEIVVETAPARTDRFVASLDTIRRTPLTQISTDQVVEIVHRIVHEEPDSPTVAVALFGSSI